MPGAFRMPFLRLCPAFLGLLAGKAWKSRVGRLKGLTSGLNKMKLEGSAGIQQEIARTVVYYYE